MSNSVPEGWDTFKVGELAHVKRGASPRPIQDTKWWGGHVGWVRISDVTSAYKYLKKTTQYLSNEGVSKSVQIPTGEVILSICATIGRPIIVGVDACIHDGFVWFDKLKKSIDREYWYYFLLSKEEFLSGQRQSGTQGNLNTSIVAELECLLPPLPEQQKIATILSSVDDVIEKTRAQIDKLKDLKSGMMQELLTKGIGPDGKPHTEFKDSPLGLIPVTWTARNVGELFKVQLGKMLSNASKLGVSPFPYLGNKNVQWGKVDLTDLEEMDFTERDRAKFSLRPGDLLMCEGGDVGRAAIWEGELSNCYYQKAIHRLRPINESYNPKLLLEYFRFAKDRGLLRDFISQTSIAHLTKEKLELVPVPVPPRREQEQIVAIFDSVNVRIEKLSEKVAGSEAIKKALMQDLLTGKVRVKIDNKEPAVA
ncbi:MAG: hypothetical protein GYB21_07070 [Oceanospirillales bacterium]|nr:hypothetical protein [Oceanospirillales bacterium]